MTSIGEHPTTQRLAQSETEYSALASVLEKHSQAAAALAELRNKQQAAEAAVAQLLVEGPIPGVAAALSETQATVQLFAANIATSERALVGIELEIANMIRAIARGMRKEAFEVRIAGRTELEAVVADLCLSSLSEIKTALIFLRTRADSKSLETEGRAFEL